MQAQTPAILIDKRRQDTSAAAPKRREHRCGLLRAWLHTEPAVLSAMRRCLAIAVVAQVASYSGRTAPGRLAWVDRYLLLKELSLFDDDEPSTTRVFCDIGIGDDATTTLELAEALQQDADAPLIVACEADANRCAGAREACAAAGVVVRQTDGSFTLPLKWDEVCVGVRAMNVFRSG